MGIFSPLDIGVRALRSFQLALQTTSHNISNVNTPGYSRQRTDFQTVTPDLGTVFQIGRGVDVSGVQRMRDQFVDAQVRLENGSMGHSDALEKTYQLLETVFKDTPDTGMSKAMTEFWNAWQEVSNSPQDLPVRANLRAKAQTLTDTFTHMSTDLDSLQQSINSDVVSEVNSLNSYGQQLALLNKDISTSMVTGQQPNDLLDKRDALLNKISLATDATISISKFGEANININGGSLVDAAGFHSIDMKPRPGNALGLVDLQWHDSGQAITINNGTIKGLIDSRDNIVSSFQDSLNTLANNLIQQVNTLHQNGMGIDGTSKITGTISFSGALASDRSFSLNGTTIQLDSGDDLNSVVGRINAYESTTGVHAGNINGHLTLTPAAVNPQTIKITSDNQGAMKLFGIVNDFFKGSGASGINLSDAVKNDLNSIAASSNGAPGDNSNALAIINLQNQLNVGGNNMSFENYYQTMISDLGNESQAATTVKNTQTDLLTQLNAMQESVSGVSLDEEMTNLMKFQRSYEAAARLISVTDQMLDTLLKI